MRGALHRRDWAVALATLVGLAGGSFLAPSMDSLGLSTEGSLPLLGGEAAIFVASVLGAVLGGGAAAVVAYLVGRSGQERTAAIDGSIGGLLVAAMAGYYSEEVAVYWVDAFSAHALLGGLVSGALAGLLGGVLMACLLRLWGGPERPAPPNYRFTALIGCIGGILAGMGGASIGSALALSTVACPTSGCVPGLLQGSLLFGMWVGGVAGSVSAPGATWLLWISRRRPAGWNPTD